MAHFCGLLQNHSGTYHVYKMWHIHYCQNFQGMAFASPHDFLKYSSKVWNVAASSDPRLLSYSLASNELMLVSNGNDCFVVLVNVSASQLPWQLTTADRRSWLKMEKLTIFVFDKLIFALSLLLDRCIWTNQDTRLDMVRLKLQVFLTHLLVAAASCKLAAEEDGKECDKEDKAEGDGHDEE